MPIIPTSVCNVEDGCEPKESDVYEPNDTHQTIWISFCHGDWQMCHTAERYD